MLTMPIAKPVVLEKQEASLFEDQVAAVMGRMRQSLVGILGSLSKGKGGGIRRAADVQRELGINRKLAWQVYKIAFGPDPLAQANHVPKPVAMEGFFEAAIKREVPVRLIKSVRAAFAEFDELVRVHAGSRSAMDSMVSGLRDDRGAGGLGSESIDVQHRRAAFNANSHIWGIHARTQLSCAIYATSATDPLRLDSVRLRGMFDLKWLRRDVSWTIARTRISDSDNVVRKTVVRLPLDVPGDEPEGANLIREFCSQPMPAFGTYVSSSGSRCLELLASSIGKSSAVTYVSGEHSIGALPRYRCEHNDFHGFITLIRTPCEVLIHDMLVARDTFGSINPQAHILGDLRVGDDFSLDRPQDRLSQGATVIYLGRGPSVLHTPEVPRYSEIAQYAFNRMGWDAAKFDVWRCRVEYPVMPSSVVVQFDLPGKP